MAALVPRAVQRHPHAGAQRRDEAASTPAPLRTVQRKSTRSVQREQKNDPETTARGGNEVSPPGEQLLSPSGKPAKEGEVKTGTPPTLQLHGYGGVRKVAGVLVKDMEKKVAELAAKESSGTPLTADERTQKGDFETKIADVNTTKRSDYLIFAGHIGVSIDNGATIYGFTPVAPEGMPKDQVVGHLHNHTMTFPGQVKDDRRHFELAERCASTKGWDTDVTTLTRTVSTSRHAEVKQELQRLAGMMPGAHGLYYSFPLQDAVDGQWFVDTPGPAGKVIKGENQANCATFPGKIGIELPEESGNLRYFMPRLRDAAKDRDTAPTGSRPSGG